MKKLVLLSIFLFAGTCIAQPILNLTTYKKDIQVVINSTKDTIDLSKFAYYKIIGVADVDWQYTLGASLDSAKVKSTETLNYPQDGWIDASIYSKIIVWSTSSGNFRFWAYGRKQR